MHTKCAEDVLECRQGPLRVTQISTGSALCTRSRVEHCEVPKMIFGELAVWGMVGGTDDFNGEQ